MFSVFCSIFLHFHQEKSLLQYCWTIFITLQHTGYFILASNKTYFQTVLIIAVSCPSSMHAHSLLLVKIQCYCITWPRNWKLLLCYTAYYQQYQTQHIWPKSIMSNHWHRCQVKQWLKCRLAPTITGFVLLNIWRH